MNKNEYTERLQEIGICEDEAQRMDLIAAMIEEGGNDYDTFEATSAECETLRSANESLKATNKGLLLRVGTHEDTNKKPGDPPKPKPKFEDLFNEKGGIK